LTRSGSKLMAGNSVGTLPGYRVVQDHKIVVSNHNLLDYGSLGCVLCSPRYSGLDI